MISCERGWSAEQLWQRLRKSHRKSLCRAAWWLHTHGLYVHILGLGHISHNSCLHISINTYFIFQTEWDVKWSNHEQLADIAANSSPAKRQQKPLIDLYHPLISISTQHFITFQRLCLQMLQPYYSIFVFLSTRHEKKKTAFGNSSNWLITASISGENNRDNEKKALLTLLSSWILHFNTSVL